MTKETFKKIQELLKKDEGQYQALYHELQRNFYVKLEEGIMEVVEKAINDKTHTWEIYDLKNGMGRVYRLSPIKTEIDGKERE